MKKLTISTILALLVAAALSASNGTHEGDSAHHNVSPRDRAVLATELSRAAHQRVVVTISDRVVAVR